MKKLVSCSCSLIFLYVKKPYRLNHGGKPLPKTGQLAVEGGSDGLAGGLWKHAEVVAKYVHL